MAGERGRPRTFDTEQALDKALHVFWKHGFQDASLHDLTAAMGLSKPSLYAAFGDKEALYLKALERYAALVLERHGQALQATADGRRAVEEFLRSISAMLADPAMPGGCFVVNGTADCGSGIPAAVDAALRSARQDSEARMLERLIRAQRDGQLAAAADVQALAAMYTALVSGLAVMAKSGADLTKLHAVITAAMAAWPAP